MATELCDVCEAPASLLCSQCHSAIYCSRECQAADHAEHVDECVHPADMTPDELLDELHVFVETEPEHALRDAALHVIGAGVHATEGAALLEDVLDAHWDEELVGGYASRARRANRRARRRIRRQARKQRRRARRTRRDAAANRRAQISRKRAARAAARDWERAAKYEGSAQTKAAQARRLEARRLQKEYDYQATAGMSEEDLVYVPPDDMVDINPV